MSVAVPIAALLRAEKRNKFGKAKSKYEDGGNKKNCTSLQKKIEALEKQIEGSGSCSDSESSDISASGGHDGGKESLKIVEGESNFLMEEDATGNVVKFVSSLSKDRIAPLQKKYLPAADCGSSKKKGYTSDSKFNERKRVLRFGENSGSKREDCKRRKAENDSSSSKKVEKEDGMEKTIREMLKDYTPASAERRPFWCRICRFQGKDENELFEHRKSEFHRTAANMEMKMSYCQLCRKQFTSPVQLKEHLSARGHKERLDRIRDANARRAKFG
jgi:hypothetical protein